MYNFKSCYICFVNPPYACFANSKPIDELFPCVYFAATAICLATVHVMASHQEHLCHHFGLLGAVLPAT